MMNAKTPLLVSLAVFVFWSFVAAWPLYGQQPSPVPRGARQMARGGQPSIPGAANRPAPVPAPPKWIPLNAKHQQYLDQLLQYWEYKSSQTKRYRCTFKRWVYNPVFGPKKECYEYSEGVIKYSAPDKGLFRVLKHMKYQPPREPGGKPDYMASKEKYHECWICDGRWVYQFDHVQKKLVQSELPPEIRGQAIGKGPLPFLFNAKADDIKRRFWLRIITPQGAKNEYWLEAVPRHQEDAGNFDMIHVIIDGTDYLPKAMIQFDPGFDAVERPARKAYQFNDREVNFSILKEQLNIFHREFYEPSVPKGWTKEVQKHVQSAGPRQSAPAGNRAARGVPATRR